MILAKVAEACESSDISWPAAIVLVAGILVGGYLLGRLLFD